MTVDDQPLVSALLELDRELQGSVPLCVGGGLGLFLKHLYLQQHPEIRTLWPLAELPPPRTTQDIDLFLRAEIVTDSAEMRLIREALNRLDYCVVEGAEFMQFVKPWGEGTVKIDFMAGPLGEFAGRVKDDVRRVRPRPSVGLHAHKVEEALGIEEAPFAMPLRGPLPDGSYRETRIHVPQAFTYLLMKLMAFRDRLNDDDKDLGRHHAVDLYRIVGLLTRDEDGRVRKLARGFAAHPIVVEARQLANKYFVPAHGIGRIRIREHKLASDDMDLDRFGKELDHLLAAPQ